MPLIEIVQILVGEGHTFFLHVCSMSQFKGNRDNLRGKLSVIHTFYFQHHNDGIGVSSRSNKRCSKSFPTEGKKGNTH